MLHACALVGWYTFVYQPTPPILIFSSSANIMNNTETNSLAKLSKIWCNSRQVARLHPCLNIYMYNSSRRFATPSFFSFLIFIQINSELNKIKIWMKLMEEMNSHMTSKSA